MDSSRPPEPVSYSQASMPVWRTLFPQRIELLAYMMVGAVGLLLLNFQDIINYIFKNEVLPPQDFNPVLAKIETTLNLSWLNTFVLLLVWMAIGGLLYATIWIIKNISLTFYDEVEVGHELAAAPQNKQTYWRSVIAHHVFFGSIVLIFVAYIFLSLDVLVPLYSRVFYDGIRTVPQLMGIVKVAMAVVASGLAIYVFTVLKRSMVASWRAFIR